MTPNDLINRMSFRLKEAVNRQLSDVTLTLLPYDLLLFFYVHLVQIVPVGGHLVQLHQVDSDLHAGQRCRRCKAFLLLPQHHQQRSVVGHRCGVFDRLLELRLKTVRDDLRFLFVHTLSILLQVGLHIQVCVFDEVR